MFDYHTANCRCQLLLWLLNLLKCRSANCRLSSASGPPSYNSRHSKYSRHSKLLHSSIFPANCRCRLPTILTSWSSVFPASCRCQLLTISSPLTLVHFRHFKYFRHFFSPSPVTHSIIPTVSEKIRSAQ